jgi:hypothetical protein
MKMFIHNHRIVFFLCAFLGASYLNADQIQSREEERINEGLSQENPIGSKQLKSVIPNEAFKYFSGNTSPLNIHPAIFAGNDQLFVVGYKYFKTFSIRDLESAFNAYQELLRLDGYIH